MNPGLPYYKLSISVHIIIILLIVTRGHVVQPLLVVEIPADSLLDTLLKLQRGLPSELFLQLRRVDGIAQIVAGTVCNEGNEIHILTFLTTQQTVNGLDDHFDDVDVLPLVETTDIISVGNLTLMENEVDGTGMILDKQPVTDILTLAIDRQRLAMADVIDKQRNQFLWELIRAVVIGAVCHDDGHSISIMVGTDKMI